MNKVNVITKADGGISVIAILNADLDGTKLAKALFEHSRTTDMDTHFDPAVHTRDAIAAGLPGHRALSIDGEIEYTDLPTDRYFRDAWTWSD